MKKSLLIIVFISIFTSCNSELGCDLPRNYFFSFDQTALNGIKTIDERVMGKWETVNYNSCPFTGEINISPDNVSFATDEVYKEKKVEFITARLKTEDGYIPLIEFHICDNGGCKYYLGRYELLPTSFYDVLKIHFLEDNKLPESISKTSHAQCYLKEIKE